MIDVYKTPTQLIMWIDDRAVICTPVWKSHDDEFTQREYFNTLVEAKIAARKRNTLIMVFDGHKWSELN